MSSDMEGLVFKHPDGPFTLYPPDPKSPEGLEANARRLLRDAALVRLAQKLGIEPVNGPGEPYVTLRTEDGRAYEWVDLMLAAIERLDREIPA